MQRDMRAADLRIGIVGTGAMGRGIAQIAAQSGCVVLLNDAQAGAAERARGALADTLDGLAARGRIAPEDARAATARLVVTDRLEEFSSCAVIIEAIVEDLEAKRALFRDLESLVAPECILATNTSSLSVTAIARGCARPQRVAGFHFFNPVPLMKVVEVIAGLLTDGSVADALVEFAERMGHAPVRAQDTPGFLVNHAGRGYTTEALRCLGEGVASAVEIDRILREAAGFRMGPFELLDLTGLDVSHPVMESIYRQFYDEPRFRPSPVTAQRLAGGLLGRKTGRGFYAYQDGKQQIGPEEPLPADRPTAVWVGGTDVAMAAAARELVARLGGPLEHGDRPSDTALCVVAPLGADATSAAAALGLDARRTVAVDLLFPNARRRTVMATPVTAPAMRRAARGLFGADGAPVSLIRDSAGFVAQRVVAHIVNIACDIAQQRIATPGDIDKAVTLGLGYPQGPLALGDGIGASRLLEVLDTLHGLSRDPRYRPSPWLRRRAQLGVSLLTPED